MIVKYRYRLYPTEEQQKQIRRFCGATRWLWNFMLNDVMRRYHDDGAVLSYTDMCSLLPLIKQQCPWLKELPSQTLQQVARELSREVRWHLSNTLTFPRYKRRKNQKGSYHIQQGIGLGEQLTLPKLGKVDWVQHRDLPNHKGAYITWENGKYHIVFYVERDAKNKKRDIPKEQSIGITVGTEYVISDSRNTKITIPPNIIKKNRRKKIRARSTRRKIKNSSNFHKSRKRTKTTEVHLMDSANDFHHKISRFLLMRNDMICIEEPMTTKSGYSRKNLVRVLEQKAERYGKTIVVVRRYDPAWITCNVCRHKSTETSCPKCGDKTDRYFNGAKNVLDWGYKIYRGGHGKSRLSVTNT